MGTTRKLVRGMALLILALALLQGCLAALQQHLVLETPIGLECSVEHGRAYSSPLNMTALRTCTGPPRPEKVCIVGGGSSGVHMGWLMRRRGFSNIVLFEKSARLGGNVWSVANAGDGNITRELGAAFLSPDYYEVRALLDRFGQNTVPISIDTMIQLHTANSDVRPGPAEDVSSASVWANRWVSTFTNTTDPSINADIVSDALNKYITLHGSIFGEYQGRFPPKPSSASKLLAINGTILDFFARHDLQVLEPMFFQFFVMQGMGLLGTMPAYYVMKWVSPSSIRAGGFGNDKSAPLAMMKDGYGSLIQALADEAGLDVRFNAEVVSVERPWSVAAASRGRSGQQHKPTYQRHDPGQHVRLTLADRSEHSCDILVLSGPITNFVRGSDSGKVAPILSPPTAEEVRLFSPKHAMQFLIQLVKFNEEPRSFKALEYWPQGYEIASGVIVRRDVGYAEHGVPHRLGGLQSYSYWPEPVCDETMHKESQAKWMAEQGLSVNETYATPFYDTYLFHYTQSDDILSGKPWQLDDIQLLPDERTIYVGGTASFETVEDSINYNLELVNRLFDNPPKTTTTRSSVLIPASQYASSSEQVVPTGITTDAEHSPAPAPINMHTRALEQLLFNFTIPCEDVERFIAADAEVWTSFLQTQDGFVRKHVSATPPLVPGRGSNCSLWSQVEWASRELWQSIPAEKLAEVQSRFEASYGSSPSLTRFPTGAKWGLDIAIAVGEPADEHLADSFLVVQPGSPSAPAMEVLAIVIDCDDVDKYISADNASWTAFLSQQPGFVRKRVMVERPANLGAGGRQQCTMWGQTWWSSRALWKAVPSAGCATAQARFVELFGSAPSVRRFPSADGLDILVTANSIRLSGSRPAIYGNDVVAYQGLAVGQMDVTGSPTIKRFFDSAPLLPQDLRHMHPQPYQFWFKTETNAALFDLDPWRYIPAFGGHCSHCVADGPSQTLNVSTLVDGRIAFTCVNTTEWVVMNNSLYMNSCSMYKDFLKDPSGDASKAGATWTHFFGQARFTGPINDACFQDGGRWGGDPIGHLLPPQCVIMQSHTSRMPVSIH